MKELDLFKALLEDDMINFNALLIKNYKKLDINEKDIIVLSFLARQESKGSRTFNPSKIRSKCALAKADLDQSLEYLTTKQYIELRLEENPKTLKQCEMFYIDNIYNKIIEIYTSKAVTINQSFTESIVNLYEELFNKQITSVDIEILKEWTIKKEFNFDDIKNEMIDASKIGKTSLKYVDQVLRRKEIEKRESPEYKEASSIIEELKNRWKK